jgi:choline dehydrogenase
MARTDPVISDPDSVDYVVVGAGTAGCVLAARLSEDPGTRVLLLEAGPSDGPPLMSSPRLADSLTLYASPVDWNYTTTPQPGTEGTVHSWPRGKVLGGSSSINAMIHLRGHRSSYDAWEAQGATGWNYDALLPFFKRSETADGRDPRFRGTSGPIHIEAKPEPDPVALATYEAFREAGYPAAEDGNGAYDEGVFWTDHNIVAGRRQSAADGYLRPVLSRPNLTVVTRAQARRVLLDGHRCRGVEYVSGGQTRTVLADREVVLSAGVIGSAQLLLLSGVGPARQLAAVGVPLVLDLPGVGANLHDHMLCWVSYSTKLPLDGGPTRQARALVRSARGGDPDLMISSSGAALLPHWKGVEPGYSVMFSLLAPASRGSLRLRSADPDAEPLIDPAYLSDERDIERMVMALRLAREVGEAPALAKWRDAELIPGLGTRDDADYNYIRRAAGTYFHAAGTCRMGTDDRAVVDPSLRVRGIDNLRVADAAVMPSIVSATTNATVLAIAERAAWLIAGQPGA